MVIFFFILDDIVIDIGIYECIVLVCRSYFVYMFKEVWKKEK